MPDPARASATRDADAESIVVETPDAEAARLAELYLTPSAYAPRDLKAREWARRVRARLNIRPGDAVPADQRERLRQQARLALALTSGKYVWARVRRPFKEADADAPLLALMDAHLRVKRLWGVDSVADEDAAEAARVWEGTFRLWHEAQRVARRAPTRFGFGQSDGDAEAAAAAAAAGAAAGAPTIFTLVPGVIQKRMGRAALMFVRRRPFLLGGFGVALLAMALTPWFVEAWNFAGEYLDQDPTNGSDAAS